MRITVIASPRAEHQITHQQALAEGLRTLGHEVALSYSGAQTDYVACWGWRIGKMHKDQGKRVLVMERGYLGDRFTYTSLAWDGLNGFGAFPEYEPDKGQRFFSMADMKPWKHTGRYALILGQVPGDASLRGKNLLSWYEDQATQVQKHLGLPVVFRPHPQALKRGIHQHPQGTAICMGPTLTEALADAALAITYNSNSGVDAVLAGVPTVAEDEGSMAFQVTSRSIYHLVRPQREQWAYSLAWKQWTIDEIRSGYALRGLC